MRPALRSRKAKLDPTRQLPMLVLSSIPSDPSHTSFVAGGHAATTAAGVLSTGLGLGLGAGRLLGSIALANASNGTVDGPSGGLRGSAGVEFRVIACIARESLAPDGTEIMTFRLLPRGCFQRIKRIDPPGKGKIYQEARRGSVSAEKSTREVSHWIRRQSRLNCARPLGGGTVESSHISVPWTGRPP